MKIITAAGAAMPKGESKTFLNPGEFYFGDNSTRIHTLLGSCIAITLWHPQKKVGGMCHFLLPAIPVGDSRTKALSELPTSELGRYAEGAMLLFEQAVKNRHTSLTDYQAKVFGGSNMLTSSTLSEDELIGNRNTEAAVRLITERGINLLVAHVGETGHRRIVFDVNSGDVWVKHERLQKNITAERRS